MLALGGLSVYSVHGAQSEADERSTLITKAFQNSRMVKIDLAQQEGHEYTPDRPALENFFHRLFKGQLVLSEMSGQHGDRFLKFSDMVTRKVWAIPVLDKTNQSRVATLLKQMSGARDYSRVPVMEYWDIQAEPAVAVCLYVLSERFRDASDERVGRYRGGVPAGVLPMLAGSTQAALPVVTLTPPTGELPALLDQSN